jgi:DNA-binding NarL/FixJ family response regulator
MSPANRSGIGKLPAESTSFVGRRRLLTGVKAAFANTRLLTLVGPAHWRRFHHYFAVPCVETQGCIQSSTHESVLDQRELEVAQLIADGLSNKRIGARLFISEATVATHVRNIMNKLGFNSRAQVAGWMVSQGL